MLELNLERYELEEGSSPFIYEFYSIGPKGKIKKVIKYQKLESLGDSYYNLAFGDWDGVHKVLNDKIVTNNNDSEKVLATVVFSIVAFMKKNPGAILLAEGSTTSRTRLYQIGIVKFWKLISLDYEIYGWADSQWDYFRPGKNYESFLVKAKN